MDELLTFRRCDLHVHSSSCESRSYGYDEFESALIGSPLDVVAITDHNIVDVGLFKQLQPKMKKAKKVLLAGVELNVYFDDQTVRENNLELSGKSEYFHGIIWCDADDVEKLQDAVYTLLDGIGIRQSDRSGKGQKEISRLASGKRFSFLDVQQALKALRHYFVFHENKGDDKRNLSGYLKKGVRANDRFKERLFYYNQRLAVEGGAKSRPITDWFERDLNTTVTRFFCSDAKTIGEIGSKFTWIDFDGDLDSLNLAITDPQSRIATSDEYPSLPQKNINKHLASVKFDLRRDGKSIECELTFAPGFNGIIGSRGSGKSMLANILAGRGLRNYAEFFDPESVRYRLAGGGYSKNPPRVLYINQGVLSCVFERSSFDSVPFLDKRLEKMKKDAQDASAKHFTAIISLLEKQEASVAEFLTKYAGSLKRPDVLLAERPNGVTLENPPSMGSDSAALERVREQVDDTLEELTDIIGRSRGLRIESLYPESRDLVKALDSRVDATVKLLDGAVAELQATKKVLSTLEDEPFQSRDELVALYGERLNAMNRSRSAAAQSYDEALSDVNAFYDDLLELRMTIAATDEQLKANVSGSLNPIKPETYKADSDEVTIELAFEEACSYSQAVSSQFKGSTGERADIIDYCLWASEPKEAKNLLNGVKFRGLQEPSQCIERLYGNIRAELEKNREFSVAVSFNGKAVKDMSPGMQAQALLKLLLNDELSDQDYDCVIFDQPEDNLDIPTISDTLVNRIKRFKREIQIFVVSHSAPVIINGDARSIVMAAADDSGISYKVGTINGKSEKQEISRVLDGGERFLKMRLYKYDFQIGDLDD